MAEEVFIPRSVDTDSKGARRYRPLRDYALRLHGQYAGARRQRRLSATAARRLRSAARSRLDVPGLGRQGVRTIPTPAGRLGEVHRRALAGTRPGILGNAWPESASRAQQAHELGRPGSCRQATRWRVDRRCSTHCRRHPRSRRTRRPPGPAAGLRRRHGRCRAIGADVGLSTRSRNARAHHRVHPRDARPRRVLHALRARGRAARSGRCVPRL